MQITECVVSLPLSDSPPQLLGYAEVVLDGVLKIRDLKIIRSSRRGIFVAMPSRPITTRCPGCHGKVFVKDPFCKHCRQFVDVSHCSHLYFDVVHPITAGAREAFEKTILGEYEAMMVVKSG